MGNEEENDAEDNELPVSSGFPEEFALGMSILLRVPIHSEPVPAAGRTEDSVQFRVLTAGN